MKRAIPWILAAVAVVAFGASFSELQRLRGRFGEVTRHQFHDHQEVRQFMIKAALAGLDHPIIVIGGSVTEMSRLPETIGGHPVVNGGIGGATISDFERIAPDVIGDARPSMIAVSLGTNDSGSDNIERDYRALLARLKKIAPKLLAVSVTRQDGSDAINAQIKSAAGSEGVPFIEEPLPAGSTLADHIHLNAAGYSKWTPALVAAIEAL